MSAHFYLGFATNHQAVRFEQAAQAAGLPGRLAPVPGALSSGCGFAWKAAAEDRSLLLDFARDRGLDFESEAIV